MSRNTRGAHHPGKPAGVRARTNQRAEPSRAEQKAALPQGGQVRPRQAGRRRARVLAFQTLYESDLSGHPPAEVLDRLCAELHTGEEARDYARQLVGGVLERHQEIDGRIASLARAWPIEQMSVVDRNLLRLGIFEATHNSSTIPVAVAINEAVELAKLYGSEASSRLVNGVLGNIAGEAERSVERPRHATAEAGTGAYQQG